MNQKFVTVFGSSIPRPGDEEYETAYRLGKKLAETGLHVCSGGFQGIMDAVSKGATENGSEAVGVTLNIYNATPSKYLTKEIRTQSLADRLNNLIEIGDAYVVLQGGTGTLVELAIVWEYFNKNMISIKPFACHNTMWKQIVAIMEMQIKRENRKAGLIQSFDDIDKLADFIINSLTAN
ncbi:MAG: LOG family protein [Melioribacteraceae bacterium]|nr:LOG family protein [Melioribacteraceae bacterium]